MREKVEKYFRILYPNCDTLSSQETYYAAGDKSFIIENIYEIDEKFQKMIENAKRDEKEIMKVIFDGVRTDKYTELLHPNREELNAIETYYAAGDREFIFEHIDEIDRKFQDMVAAGEIQGEEINEQELLKVVFDGVRANKYTELLHQNSEELSVEEMYYAAGDRSFIIENIDEIDKKFQDMIANAERNEEEVNEQEIIKDIVDSFRVRRITTQDIEKVVMNVPENARINVKKVENSENTKEKGEEIGDDN